MSFKKAALDSIRGIVPGKLPYAPRFDIWFNAHTYRGTLPEMYRDCSTPLDIARKTGVGGHCIIPDYIRPPKPEDMYDRGIGIYHLPQVPYRVTLNRVERTVSHSGYETTVTYKTPKGSVRVSFEESEDMKHSGATISWITEHAIKSEDDYDPLIFLFENIEVEKSYEGMTAMIEQTGDDGLVAANASMPGSPMQYIMRDLIDIKSFYMEMMDKPDRLKALTEAIGGYFERFMPIAASSPGEVIMFGANMDETITYPPFYEEHIMPWIIRFSSLAHKNGKYILIHADGENQALFDLYRQSGIDILEAVATSPMTKSDIHEVLEKTEGMTVFGGIPSVVLMPENDKEKFELFMDNTLETIGKRSQFILGVSDTTPPDADFDRLLRIRDKIA